MLTRKSDSIVRLARWQQGNIAKFALLSVAVVAAEELFGGVADRLPDVPVTVLGAAISIYVGFRTNSAYDRWWEGRKLWGQLVNTSRHLVSETIAYLPGASLSSVRRQLLLRIAQYAHLLRCELRDEAPAQDQDYARIALEGPFEVGTSTTHLQQGMLELLVDNAPALHELRLQSFDRSLTILLDVQGGCERIKNTPLPPAYGFIAEVLIRVFAVLLPLAIVDELHWWAIPVSVLICLAFKLISEVGRVLENPFTREWESLPLHAISRGIEGTVRDALGHERPSRVVSDDNGVLL